ncbi:hypothetical protein GCM10028784_06580 [Myceligenerans cantabricum]
MTLTAATADLVRQVRGLAHELHPRLYPVSVRVRLAGTGPALALCEVWTGDGDAMWVRRCDLPAAVGRTMLDLEGALIEAGYVFDLTEERRPKWRYDANGYGTYTLDITRPIPV